MNDLPDLDERALQRVRRLGGADLVHRLVTLYLDQGPERLRALADGVAHNDAHRVEQAAHTLKSSAGNVGAARLQASAERTEALAATGVVDAQLAREVQAAFDSSAAQLRHLLEELEK